MHNPKRSNWLSEAKLNKHCRPFCNGTGSNKFVKSQANKCERRAAKKDVFNDVEDYQNFLAFA